METLGQWAEGKKPRSYSFQRCWVSPTEVSFLHFQILCIAIASSCLLDNNFLLCPSKTLSMVLPPEISILFFLWSLHESLKVNYCSVVLSSKHKFCVFTVLNMWLNLHFCLLLNFPNPFTARDSALCLKTPLFLSPALYFLFPKTDLKGL